MQAAGAGDGEQPLQARAPTSGGPAALAGDSASERAGLPASRDASAWPCVAAAAQSHPFPALHARAAKGARPS